MAVFHGHRLAALRRIFGQSQVQLATALDIGQPYLSQIERGQRPTPEALAVAASTQYGLPLSFFAVPPSPLESAPITFRKKASASARDEARISEFYNEAARLFAHVSIASGLQPATLPDAVDYGGDSEAVATEVRRRAGLRDTQAVMNVTRLLERFGVGVVHHLDEPGHSNEFTGLCRPSTYNDRPLIALVGDVPGAVKRLTLAHEAFHLIADTALAGPITSVKSVEERRAFAFAGALLLPAAVVRERVTETLNLHGYLPIKAEYGISVQAIIHRARDLGVISSSRYRSLTIQWSSQGWRTKEPVDVADERPVLLNQAVKQTFGAQSVARASHVVGPTPEWITRWVQDEPSVDGDGVGAEVIDLSSARLRTS